MIADELKYKIHEAFGFAPTADQERAIEQLSLFLSDRSPNPVMLLRGSAGTGKTTLAAAIVKALMGLKQKMVLMAPTGRAAKVFSLYSHHVAFTIHRRIYRQRSAGDLSSFSLSPNLFSDTLFIVDEASMIASTSLNEMFGTGSLLDDLISYVYSGNNCRLMLIGDAAQLPPVGEEESPALMSGVLQGYGLTTYESNLQEVLRQSQESGILYNATLVRLLIMSQATGLSFSDNPVALPKLRIKGFPDIVVVPGDELIESLASSYSHVGVDETLVVTRSNKRANIYNEGIRRTVLDRDDELCRGDQLMIVKNNYTVAVGTAEGVFNGDRCVVRRVRNTRELYGFRFADVTLEFPDYEGTTPEGEPVDNVITVTTLLDVLSTEAPALTREQHEQLFQNVMADYADIPRKADRLRKLKSDTYYNALQVKFGYAVTCHKAQGGQWSHVYIDQGYMTDDMLTPDYIHWLYTALTRATERVFLVNWPKTQIEED